MEVDYIDHMGDDLRVVNAARISFGKEEDILTEKDEKLIRYLAEHEHFTPFTHCMITLKEKVPLFIARQRFKHTVGFTYNEVSRRYKEDNIEFFFPEDWRSRPVGGMKQGSSDPLNKNTELLCENIARQSYDKSITSYEDLLSLGVAPEQARMVLPQSMYTEYYVTGSLMAWSRAYKLRVDRHAQKEWTPIVKKWYDIIQPLFPVSWTALIYAYGKER